LCETSILEAKILKYLKIFKEGIEILEREKRLTPDELVELLGQTEPLSRANYLPHLFSDLVVLVSNRWTMPAVAKTQTGEFLFGEVYIFRKIPLTDGYELGGLTEFQIASVRQELRLPIASRQQPASAQREPAKAMCGENV
jgi:hypothetical protein